MEKTLGQIAWEAHLEALPARANRWQVVADAVIAAYEARRWLSIESAPKDGTPFLAWHEDWAFPDIVWRDGDGWCHDSQPTHWTPIPAPPKEASDAE